jgi:hypothetical protein
MIQLIWAIIDGTYLKKVQQGNKGLEKVGEQIKNSMFKLKKSVYSLSSVVLSV